MIEQRYLISSVQVVDSGATRPPAAPPVGPPGSRANFGDELGGLYTLSQIEPISEETKVAVGTIWVADREAADAAGWRAGAIVKVVASLVV